MMMLAFHCALLVAWAGAAVRARLPAPAARRLWFARGLLLAALVSPLLAPRSLFSRWQGAPAQVWSSAQGVAAPMEQRPVLQIAAGPAGAVRVHDWNAWIAAALATLIVAVLLGEALALRRKLQGTLPLRSLGRVRVVVSAAARSPWTAVFGRSAWVVLDPATARDAKLRRLVLRHELQHLRARDAHWAWGLAVLRPAFFFNPAASWMCRLLTECEELACDEAVLRRHRIDPRRYASALIEVAERGLLPPARQQPALYAHSALRKRIEALLAPVPQPRVALDGLLLAGSCLLIGAAAAAAGAAVTDHRLDASQMAAMAQRASTPPAFAVPVNDLVTAEANRLAATPEGRQHVAGALKRRQSQLATIRAALESRKLPAQLEAVVLIESGYENIDAGPNGAGLWQFIAPTAQRYGLRVESGRDERMDTALESGAAARYLADLYQVFGDWPLALAAYTQGEKRVQSVIEREKTRDAWELIRRGALDRYPAKVMAAALLLADPAAAGFDESAR